MNLTPQPRGERSRVRVLDTTALLSPATDDGDEILTVKEAAKMLRLAPRTLLRRRADGPADGEPPLPFVRLGRRKIGYRRADIRAFVAARTFPHRAAELSEAA